MEKMQILREREMAGNRESCLEGYVSMYPEERQPWRIGDTEK